MLLFIRGITPINTLLSICIFLGFSLSIFLLAKRSHKSYANTFLACLMLIYTMFLIPGYLYGARILEYVPHISNWSPFLYVLLGPLIYFYTKANTQKSFRLQKIDLLHLIPFLIFMIIDWKHLLLSGPEKIESYINTVENGIYPFPLWIRIAKIVLNFSYFLLSFRLTLLYKKHLSQTSSSIDRRYFQWLLLFSSTLLIPLVGFSLVALTQFKIISVTFFAFSTGLIIMTTYFAVLFKPSLFLRFPNQMESMDQEQEEKKKYEQSSLQDAQKDRLVSKLLSFVETEKPYLEPELTLGQLSEQVDIPAHYLSQIINERIQKSFGDFINNYRVEKAKVLLTDQKYNHYTIISTAYEAGFNSKSAFYSAFKKFTGTTPSEYRKRLKAS